MKKYSLKIEDISETEELKENQVKQEANYNDKIEEEIEVSEEVENLEEDNNDDSYETIGNVRVGKKIELGAYNKVLPARTLIPKNIAEGIAEDSFDLIYENERTLPEDYVKKLSDIPYKQK